MRRCLPLFAVALVVVWQSPSAAETAGEFRQQRSESPSTGNEPSQSVLLPPSFVFDGEVREWQGLPPTFELVEAENSRPGAVWVSQTDGGLLVAGEIGGSAPRWPGHENRMALGDHIEIWLADATPPTLPPIGWGNQFRYHHLGQEEECDELKSTSQNVTTPQVQQGCKEWFRKQVNYRRLFKKLFTRQWQAAPDVVRETYASPVFERFNQNLKNQIGPLRPTGNPEVKISESGSASNGYGFEMLIAWRILPPVQSFRIDEVRLLVDVFSPGQDQDSYGVFSTSSERRRYGDLQSFNRVRLNQPREYFVTRCRDDLANLIILTNPSRYHLRPSELARTYYFPTEGLTLSSLLVLENQAAGYQYLPNPLNYSPTVKSTSYFEHSIGEGETLCGPSLSYVNKGEVSRSKYLVEWQDHLSIKTLPTGNLLLMDGPRAWDSYFGSGQCGACPRVTVDVYHLDRGNGRISRAFEYRGIHEWESSSVDIQVSEDWNSITVFRGYLSPVNYRDWIWGSVTHCFQQDTLKYVECGSQDSVVEPSPRTVVIPTQ